MKHILPKINNKIQNYSHKSPIVDENPEIYVASDFTTHQWFWILVISVLERPGALRQQATGWRYSFENVDNIEQV